MNLLLRPFFFVNFGVYLGLRLLVSPLWGVGSVLEWRNCLSQVAATPGKRADKLDETKADVKREVYSPRNDPGLRNDPQPWNDPQIDPEMIPTPKWSSLFFLSTPKWSPRNYGMVIKHGTVDCSIIRESKDILAYVVNRFTAPILTTKRE